MALPSRRHASVTTTEPCPDCRRPITVGHTQHIMSGGVCYAQGFRCEHCGCTVEADFAEMPEHLRSLVISTHGRWQLRVTDCGPHRPAAARALADALHLPRAEALALLRVDSVISDGTHVEIEWLRQQLTPHGIVVSVVEVE